MKPRTHEKISRAFKRDFPEAVPMVEKLGLTVRADSGRRVNDMPTYWLDGIYQLTGYRTNQFGLPFTKAMAAALIEKRLKEIAEGRAEVAAQTREQRFRHLVEEMRTIELKYRNFCTYRHPSGDEGVILDMASATGWVRLWDEEKEIAHAEDWPIGQLFLALEKSFASGGTTVSGRRQRTA